RFVIPAISSRGAGVMASSRDDYSGGRPYFLYNPGRADRGVKKVGSDPTMNIGAANREALDRLCRARPAGAAVKPAADAVGLAGRSLLHAGPPITWDHMCAPMRGAVTAAVLFEGWAGTAAEAERLAAAGEIALSPCHSRGAVGPMAGVISPSTPLLVVEDAVN